MLREMLGLSERLMMILHEDHQKVDGMITEMLSTKAAAKRGEIFRQMRDALEAHAKAEEKILYKRLEKSQDEEVRKFAFEAGTEHGLVYELLDQLGRARDKSSEQWTAKLTVLQEMIHHHVQEEETTGFSSARSECDKEELEKMATRFEREKEKLLA
jgi:hemerythrin superfamily protein